ncbi:MAG TPA: helix-turn-helix transcriptional regulator, partial [Acidimicrobiales bacterium]|nr:helix-turn-helix transcriptional regulator [Acidimicrobiales bacterium]
VSDRDREVLRLLADGCDTSEIARALAYSEPTIKNAIQRLFDQLKARNRPHAVALALRSGII